MANQPGYLRSVFEYYDNLSSDAIKLMMKAMNGSTPSSELSSKAVSLWMRGAMGPWAPWLVGNPFAVPKVHVAIKKGETKATGSIPWTGDSSIALTPERLIHESGSPSIAAAKVKPRFSLTGDALIVDLENLAATYVPGDKFEGALKAGNTIIAIIWVTVKPA
jgi:hypothetical protein